MSKNLLLLGVLAAGLLVAGCSKQGAATTEDAGQDVVKSADKGGAAPSPNLLPPVAGGGAPPAFTTPNKTSKFAPAGPGGK